MKKSIIILFTLCSVFFLSYIIIEFAINPNTREYVVEINNSNPNYNFLNDIDYWQTHNDKNIDLSIFYTKKIDSDSLSVKAKNLNYKDANYFLCSLVNNNLDESNINYVSNIKVENDLNALLIASLLTLVTGCVSLFFIKKKSYQFKLLSAAYWKSSMSNFKNIKTLNLIAIFLALQLVLSLVKLPSGFADLGLSLGYLLLATTSYFFGPAVGIIIGGIGDILGFFMMPNNIFFPGYTLSAMLSGGIYGILFYRNKITFLNVFLSRFFINIFINVFLGTLWYSILFGVDGDALTNYLLYISLPKNIIYLLPQSILLFLYFKVIKRVTNLKL